MPHEAQRYVLPTPTTTSPFELLIMQLPIIKFQAAPLINGLATNVADERIDEEAADYARTYALIRVLVLMDSQ